MCITGTIVVCMGNINLCTNMHNQIPPARGGKGGGELSIGGIDAQLREACGCSCS